MTASPAATGDGGRLAVVLGPSDDLRAEIFVRGWPPRGVGVVRLGGTLTGPRCRWASTLPVVVRLATAAAASDAALARAVLTEPSYWTPELPNLYRLEANLVDGERTLATFDLPVGLRRLGVRGRSFWLDGRRWVPRGIGLAAGACRLSLLREGSLAAALVDPELELCAEADEIGVPIIGLLPESDDAADPGEALARITAWAPHPSVVLAVMPLGTGTAHAAAVGAAIRPVQGTLLLGQAVDGSLPPPTHVAEGVACLVVRLAANVLPDGAWRARAPKLPLVAWREDGGDATTGRRGCDRLQAELAAWGLADGAAHPAWEWAGYVVS